IDSSDAMHLPPTHVVRPLEVDLEWLDQVEAGLMRQVESSRSTHLVHPAHCCHFLNHHHERIITANVQFSTDGPFGLALHCTPGLDHRHCEVPDRLVWPEPVAQPGSPDRPHHHHRRGHSG